MAVYSTTTAAIALGVERKLLENLLGRSEIPGISPGRQGRARRLSQSSLLAVAAVLRLQDVFGIPASRAVGLLADGLLATNRGKRDADGVTGQVAVGHSGAAVAGVRRGPFLLELDVTQLERDLTEALRDAMEMSPRPRRGRPPHRASSGG